MAQRIERSLRCTLLVAAALTGSCGGTPAPAPPPVSPAPAVSAAPTSTGTASSIPAPSPVAPIAQLPAVPPDGIASDFPPIVAVTPPPALKASLAAIESPGETDPMGKLTAMVDAHAGDVHLARYLCGHDNPSFVRFGIGMWPSLAQDQAAVPTLVSLLNHKQDFIVSDAAAMLVQIARPDTAPTVLPYFRKLAQSSSCNRKSYASGPIVALSSLVNIHEIPPEVLRALDDPCAIVRSSAARSIREGGGADAEARLSKLAARDPTALVRCRAIVALGKLKAKGAEKLFGAAMLDASRTDLLWVDAPGGDEATFATDQPTMAHCAAEGYSWFRNNSSAAKGRDSVKAAREDLASRHFGAPPPKNFCVATEDCSEEHVCVKYACEPASSLVAAYWKFQAARACPRPGQAGWRDGDEEAIKAGLGVAGSTGVYRIQKYLQSKDKNYGRRLSELQSKCR